MLVSTNADQPSPGSRWSLKHFRATIRSYLVALSEIQLALREMYTTLFEEDSTTVHPLDCRIASDTLTELHTLLKECISLLHQESLLPIGALAPRYRLLFTSQIVQDQALRLINLCNDYRLICLNPSPQAARVRKNIRDGFQTILKHIPDIPRQALSLEEESKSLEQELTNAWRERYA